MPANVKHFYQPKNQGGQSLLFINAIYDKKCTFVQGQ
jgi:hypothetical protein